jgi:hypothetical protein
VVISSFIVTGLLRSKTGWAKTDQLIKKLVLLTFECQVRERDGVGTGGGGREVRGEADSNEVSGCGWMGWEPG